VKERIVRDIADALATAAVLACGDRTVVGAAAGKKGEGGRAPASPSPGAKKKWSPRYDRRLMFREWWLTYGSASTRELVSRYHYYWSDQVMGRISKYCGPILAVSLCITKQDEKMYSLLPIYYWASKYFIMFWPIKLFWINGRTLLRIISDGEDKEAYLPYTRISDHRILTKAILKGKVSEAEEEAILKDTDQHGSFLFILKAHAWTDERVLTSANTPRNEDDHRSIIAGGPEIGPLGDGISSHAGLLAGFRCCLIHIFCNSNR
jgi:hypothetical protein